MALCLICSFFKFHACYAFVCTKIYIELNEKPFVCFNVCFTEDMHKFPWNLLSASDNNSENSPKNNKETQTKKICLKNFKEITISLISDVVQLLIG